MLKTDPRKVDQAKVQRLNAEIAQVMTQDFARLVKEKKVSDHQVQMFTDLNEELGNQLELPAQVQRP